MTTAYSTINAPFKYPLKEEELAHFIKTKQLPEKYKEHIYAFFTEVSTSVMYKFMMEHEISLQQMNDYYLEYVKGQYTNNNLEGMFKLE